MNIESLPSLAMLPPAAVKLTGTQTALLDRVDHALASVQTVALIGMPGSGKSTIAAHIAQRHGGRLLGLSDIAEALVGATPGRMDEVIGAWISGALERYPVLVIDDFESILSCTTTERERLLLITIVPTIHEMVRRLGRKLVLVGAKNPDAWWVRMDELLGERTSTIDMPGFSADDYAAMAANLLGSARIGEVDFRVIHRQASMLDAYQIVLMCRVLPREGDLSTEDFLACLRDWISHSNLDLGQVEALSFDSLPGSEHIAEALETYVALPFENPGLAQEMGLTSKRGVLLYGPPGTGKTSIGRALAHRMKGKFFMIDGTLVSEPPTAFFKSVQAIVAEAKASSPSVLFIDDADVLFGISHIAGLERYLLSLLDGLESESARNVCVMMTAMDARRIPEALMRSGRVELWLETRPPDEEVRARILQRWLEDGDIPGHGDVDYVPLARATEGFTPADIRRIVADAKLIYAADVVAGHAPATTNAYLSEAIDDIIAVRERMAEQLGDDALRVGRAA